MIRAIAHASMVNESAGYYISCYCVTAVFYVVIVSITYNVITLYHLREALR